MDGDRTRTPPGSSLDSVPADAATGDANSPRGSRIPPLELFRRSSSGPRPQVRIAGVVGNSPGNRPGSPAAASRSAGVATPPEGGQTIDAYALLKSQIMTGVHLGYLEAGDRLPSIRSIARDFGISHHTAVRTYRQLEADGLVEKRGRSGIFVADLSSNRSIPLMETGSWIAEVLVEACEHQIRIPWLPELIRRWTTTSRVLCACVESDEDSLRALCLEFSTRLGVECEPIAAELFTSDGGEELLRRLPPRLQEADVLVTTTFHAPRLRWAAELMGKPLVIARADPHVVEAIDQHLIRSQLTLVCVDPVFGERISAMRYAGVEGRIRVVLAHDSHGLARLDRNEPILLTRAARERLGNFNVRLLTPHFPAFSLGSARELATLMVRINMEAERR